MTEPKKLFEDEIQQAVRFELVRMMEEAQAAALAYALERLGAVPELITPQLRRAMLDNDVLNGAWLKYGLEVVRHPVQGGSVAMLRSDRVVLTFMTRSEPTTRIDGQPYRDTLAESSQTELWPSDKTPGDAKKLYGLIQFGGPVSSGLLSFARVYFPLPDGSMADGFVDLLAEYKAASRAADSAPEIVTAMREARKEG